MPPIKIECYPIPIEIRVKVETEINEQENQEVLIIDYWYKFEGSILN